MYTKAIAKINDQKLFAVKIRNIADISNKRRKINKSSIAASLLIKLTEFFADEKLLIFQQIFKFFNFDVDLR